MKQPYSQFSRRYFLSTGAKSAAGLGALGLLPAGARPVLLASAAPQGAGGRASALQPAFARLDEFVTRHMGETGAPGLTLALANREGPLRVSTYGLADIKTGARVQPETLFQIGSISKSFVAVLLLQLRDEGKLDLHKPVTQYLPWLKINSRFEPITTHHLLSHTAGLPGAPLLLDALLAELPTGTKPGTHFLYSNTGYNILGFLVEALDARPFAAAMRARVLEPLGMRASAPVISNETRGRMAVGYQPFDEDRPFPFLGRLAEAPWIEMDMAAGSVAATPADMASYVRALLNRGALPRGGRLFSEESFRLMTTPAIKAPFRGEDASYGYGLWISDINGHTRLRHTGGMVAFSSALDVDVSGGVGAFASVNANLAGYRPVAVARFAVDALTASSEGKPLPPLPSPTPTPEEIKNAADFAGAFTSPDGRKIAFAAEGSRLLLLHDGRRVTLERSRAGADQFVTRHPDFALYRLAFGREKGRVVEVSYGADWYAGAAYAGARTFDRPKEWDAYVGHYFNDSPWYGSTRVLIRKGQLLLDGAQTLLQTADGSFMLANDESAPDRIRFESIVGGRAMRLNYSGIVFRRVFTP
ncbi:MAG TPA: serine hydrolase domain-containing protein [Pyrinomonadaceae bacterium]|jgi:CubicO group peptidase (beta-lactamase class C family)|nr:serine hydrolase domain-containing protein [Pyrinomonadaceae bacterium]